MRLLIILTLTLLLILVGCSPAVKDSSTQTAPTATEAAAEAPAETPPAESAPAVPDEDVIIVQGPQPREEQYPQGWENTPWGQLQLEKCSEDLLEYGLEESIIISMNAPDEEKHFIRIMSQMRELAEGPDQSFERRQELFKQLRLLKQNNTQATDTMLMHAWIFAGDLMLAPVREYLADSLGVDPSAIRPDHPIVIDPHDWQRVRFKLMLAKNGRVLSDFPEFFNLDHKPSAYHHFLNTAHLRHLYDFSTNKWPSRLIAHDTMIGTITDQGFESINHVFTIWKVRSDGKYELVTVLDSWLQEGIGYVQPLQLHPLKGEGHILVGTSQGADGGDAWGSLWVALWSPPRQLRLLEFWPWQSQEATFRQQLTYTYSPASHTLRVIKKHYCLDPESWEEDIITDSTATRYEVRIPEILGRDKTLEFNWHCRLE